MTDSIGLVAILAGGKSSRMGVDKAAVRVGGLMMLERVARTAVGLGSEVLVVGRKEPPAGWPKDLSLKFVPDAGEEFTGPLGGLITALEFAQQTVLLLGCDMPLLTTPTLRALQAAHVGAAAETRATMAVSRDAGAKLYAEPTLSVYTPGMLPMLKEMFRSGRRSFQPLLRETFVCKWEVPAEAVGELLNVNDAETLAQAERALKFRR